MHDLDRLRSEMEELFSDLWQGRRLAGVRRAFRPAVDVYRTDVPPAVTVVCDLARLDAGHLEHSLSDGVLSITGVRRRHYADRVVYHQIELDHGPFERHVPVGEDARADEAEAAFDRGLLVVRLPLRQESERPPAVPIRIVRRS